MKKTLLVLFAAGSIAFRADAQVDPVGAFNRHVLAKWSDDYIRVGTYRVKGSPYLLGASFPGTIKLANGKVTEGQNVLYNLYEQKAGLDQAGQLFEPGDAIEQFTLSLPEEYGNATLTLRPARVFSGDKGYFEVLADGDKFSFLKKYNIRLIADPANTMDKDARIFDQYYEYYLFNRQNRQLHKVKLREKDIAKELNNEAWVKAYMAQQPPQLFGESYIAKMIEGFNNSK